MKTKSKAVSLDHIVLSKASGAREEGALESTMHSLALDHRSPIALELAATSKGCRFLLRSDSAVAQRHLAQQIQARYPQIGIQAASTDPLALQENEECSAVELRPGAASYLPLRSWKPRDLLLEGVDPLLGILGACRHLPDDIRVVAHLALLPASPTWSAPHQRRAVEHPLAPEQERARFHQRNQVPSPAGILPLLLLVVLLLFLRAHPVSLPGWLTQAGASVIHGHMPHLSLVHALAVMAGGVGILLLMLLLFVGVAFIQRMLGYGAIYDQRLVEEKTSRPAYRVLVRLVAVTTLSQSTQARPKKQRGSMLASAQALLESFSASPQERQVKRAQRRQQRKVKREKRRQARQRKAARKDVLRMLAAAYRQYHLASGGFFRLRWLSARRSRRYLRVISGHAFLWGLRWRLRLRVSNHLLSVADLAALWHLPQQQDLADLSYIEATQSRTLLVPAALTTGQGYQIGTSSHAGYTAPVFLPASCLHRNVLAVASTGKGKSNLFLLLAQAYLRAKAAGEQDAGGFVVVDPHGDVIDQLTGCVPPDLEDQVEVIDLSDRAFPVGINPLDLSGGQDRDKVVDNVVQIIAALWDLDEAPRTRNVLEYACKTLAEANLAGLDDPSVGPDQQYTLLDVVPLLRQKEFRHVLMEQLAGDPLLREWWGQYYEQLDASLQADFSSSVVTRLSRFASTRISRRMLGQPRSTIDLTEVIRQEKILLIKGASGEVGSDLATLMVSLLVGLFQVALAEQARLAPAERRRFFVLIDEFQVLSGINYQHMLAELRKYGGSFALATQSLAYLDHLNRQDRTLRATVLANIDHLFAFAMSADDARLLHLDGVEPADITGLSDYECYARLSLHGHRLPLFSLRLAPSPEPDEQQRQRIRERGRQRSGRRPVEDIDALLQERQARRANTKPGQRTRRKAGEYDGYEYQKVLSPGEEQKPEKERGERKRGSGKRADEQKQQAAVPPRHTMYDPPAAQKESASSPVDGREEETNSLRASQEGVGHEQAER
jgi:hypothetical protein